MCAAIGSSRRAAAIGRWVIALIACAAGIAVLPAHARETQVVLARSVFATHGLPSNATTTFTVACPAGHSALSAGVYAPAAGTVLLALKPAGTGRFTFRFRNPSPNPARQVTVVVACREIGISIRSQGPVLKLLQRRTAPIAVPAGAQRSASIACPGGTAPAGSGQDLGAALSVRRVSAGLHGFSFLVANYGKASARAVFYGNCVTVVRPAAARRARLHFTVATVRRPVPLGLQQFGHSCPRGWFSLATGYGLPATHVQMEGSAAVGNGGKWSVRNNESPATLVDFQLACGQLRSS